MKRKIERKGERYQVIKIKIPKTKIKISKKIPAKIKKNLKIAPIILEIKFETKTSKYFPRSNPFGYCQQYLCQWEKKVFKRKGIEKYLIPNFKKFEIAFEISFGNSTKCQKKYKANSLISLKV